MLNSKLRRLLAGILAAAFLLVSSVAGAREIPASNPERQGFSSNRLERLTTHMQQQVADGVMVGGMGVIARNGKVVYARSYGQADREAGRQMTDDAIYRIYSMTKPVTAVALMMLFEEGKFLLNDPVANYLPELANLKVARSTADTPVAPGQASDGTRNAEVSEAVAVSAGATRAARRQPTMRDVLLHTAGFTYGVFGRTEVDRAYLKAELLAPHLSLQEFVQRLGQLPLQYDPGSRWHYSVSVDVQGRLVEVLSGMSFADFLQTRIFAPLDMRDTSFFFDPAKRERVAQIYVPAGMTAENYSFATPVAGHGLDLAPPMVDAGYQSSAKFVSGGGGLLSTARDYLRFAQALLNGGELYGVRLLSPKTVALMTSDHLGAILPTLNNPGYGFGLGFGVMLDPAAAGHPGSPGEYRWGGAAGTSFWVDPEENLIGLWMVQSIPHHTRLAAEFRTLTYQALVE